MTIWIYLWQYVLIFLFICYKSIAGWHVTHPYIIVTQPHIVVSCVIREKGKPLWNDIIEVPVCHCHKSLEFTLDWPKSRCRAWDYGGRKYISFIGRVTREGISKEEEWIFWISNTMYYRCYGNSYMWTLLNIVVFCGGCLSLKLYFIGNIYIFQCFDHGTGF